MFVNFVNVTNGVASTVARLRYFYNCTAIFLGIAILISGLSPSSSAPATSDSQWLVNPCSRQPPPIRHGRSPAVNQLGIFIPQIEKIFFKQMKALYNAAEDKKMNGNCPRINNMLKPLRNAENFTTANYVFYETLLQFAIFIDRLKDIPIETPGDFPFSKRSVIYEKVKKNLRLVICEFNETLGRYEEKNMLPIKPEVPKINMKCLPSTMDLSQAHWLDIDFFKKMKKFLKQSKRLLKQKKQTRGRKVVKKSEPKVKKRTRKLKH